MPKVEMNYQNTIIYKIVPKDLTLELIYIGHTTNFIKRKSGHKTACININNTNNKNYHTKVYQMMRENGGWENWEMIEIEKYPCDDKNEACKRERELMEEYNANLNMNKAIRSQKEYYETHKEEITLYKKEWQNAHKEEKKEYDKIRRIENIEIIKQKKKEYSEANKDIIKEKSKIFYKANKDIILKKYKEKYTCECGSICRIDGKLEHNKSQKHQKYLDELI